jgi:hypothetical protein
MAGKTSSERVSVRGYLVPYLKEVASQIGTDDLSEVVNHLLTCQKLGCFGLPQSPASTPVSVKHTELSVPSSTELDDNALADQFSDLLAA